MSGIRHDVNDVHETGKDNGDSPQSIPMQSSGGMSNSDDHEDILEDIFLCVCGQGGEQDKRMTEDWKGEAENVFLFTGLSAAVVAPFISMSIQVNQANPQDTSNFCLANI
ncbi:hypothetical protein EI94DRAFT_1791597, partial [Lactarius quietus]